ncbi:MAG TPA: DUF167 domain-containing protein [Rubrivivax sp.]|nr:DUF167 domain-containing protein [Pseudomonadota bacterium]HOL37588.1 DUF167 domain-containing protein [Rubrivivax sp.]HPP82558.1 DUF167 domain-containing protein [Rubrivivax sp.]
MSTSWPCLAAGRAHGTAAGGVRLALAVVPGARRTGADGLFDGALRLRLAAPPADGKANEALLAWLAAELRLPRRALTLVHGPSTRRKTVAIDAPLAEVQAWLDRVLGAHGDETTP